MSLSRDPRPRNIDIPSILSYSLPLPGIISILHRLSGVFIFLCIGTLLWLLQGSLDSKASFDAMIECTNSLLFKAFIWLMLSAVIFHMIAGIKHLFMDLGAGEELPTARRNSLVVLAISVVLILWVGVRLW